MMMGKHMGYHRCGHRIVAKLLYALAWISAIIFWWVAWKGTYVWMMDANAWFQMVVVFSLLAFGTKFCWCWHGGGYGMMKEGMMKGGEVCTDENCKEMHDEHGKHMM